MTEGHDAHPAARDDPSIPVGVRVEKSVVWQQVDGQVVLLESTAGRYYALDEVGSRIWQVLLECPILVEIEARLLAIFDVDEATLRRDLAELIDQMAQADLLSLTA